MVVLHMPCLILFPPEAWWASHVARPHEPQEQTPPKGVVPCRISTNKSTKSPKTHGWQQISLNEGNKPATGAAWAALRRAASARASPRHRAGGILTYSPSLPQCHDDSLKIHTKQGRTTHCQNAREPRGLDCERVLTCPMLRRSFLSRRRVRKLHTANQCLTLLTAGQQEGGRQKNLG